MARSLPLSEVTFVVVDIETTGSVPALNAITEIAAVKVQDGKIIGNFSQLVNPNQPIPAFIQKLTGITPEMVATAPVIADVMPTFWKFLGTDLFVAHNAAFDFGFLNTMTKMLRGQYLENPQLCTLRLARRLLPQLKKRNLGAVAEHFDIVIEQRHRALGDAMATALVLIEFLKQLEAEGITTFAKLMDAQKRGARRYPQLQIPFPEHRIADFPSRPGVYFMRNAQGEILYIGKAKDLKKRLQSYFYNLRRQPRKVQEMMVQVFDIETLCLGSELEALLEEARLIKQHQPFYNRQIKRFRSFSFIKITVNEPYPRLLMTGEIENDNALDFGPYTRKQSFLSNILTPLTQVFQLRSCSDTVFQKYQKLKSPCIAYDVGKCVGPCVAKVSMAAYHQQVQEIVQFLEGNMSTVLDRMMARREEAAEALQYEIAQSLQENIIALLKLQAKTTALVQAVHQNHCLIALPDRQPGRLLLLYIYKGRPFFKHVFDPQLDTLEAVEERIQAIQQMLVVPSSDRSDVIYQEEVAELQIIAQWLSHRTPEKDVTVWDLTQPIETLLPEIRWYLTQQLAALSQAQFTETTAAIETVTQTSLLKHALS